MARGGPVIRRSLDTPPEGVPDDTKILMVHPGKGYRWIPKELREKKEAWGFEYVRDYSSTDELNTNTRIEDMTPEQLREHSTQLEAYAKQKETDAKKAGPAEQAYLRRKAEKDALDAEDAARVADMGLVQPSSPPSGATTVKRKPGRPKGSKKRGG